jgi:hypothetical protein
MAEDINEHFSPHPEAFVNKPEKILPRPAWQLALEVSFHCKSEYRRLNSGLWKKSAGRYGKKDFGRSEKLAEYGKEPHPLRMGLCRYPLRNLALHHERARKDLFTVGKCLPDYHGANGIWKVSHHMQWKPRFCKIECEHVAMMKRPCARTQLPGEPGNQVGINLNAMKRGISIFKMNAQRPPAGAYLKDIFFLPGANAVSDALRVRNCGKKMLS